jgi:hypothetical protein
VGDEVGREEVDRGQRAPGPEALADGVRLGE